MKANPRACALVSRPLPIEALKPGRLLFAALLVAGLLAGCVPQRPAPSPRPTPTPTTAPVAHPTAPRTTNWRDAAITPGNWSYAADAGGSSASFGGGLFVMHCTRAQATVTLLRAGSGASAPVPVSISTSQGTRTLMATPAAQGVAVTLPARDPLLDAMAFSRGRFAVETAGGPALYIPSWTEVSRVIEDCR